MIVTSKIMGQSAQVSENFQGQSVADLKVHLGLSGAYTVNVNGSPASDETTLSEGAFVVLAPAVKGAWAQLALFQFN